MHWARVAGLWPGSTPSGFAFAADVLRSTDCTASRQTAACLQEPEDLIDQWEDSLEAHLAEAWQLRQGMLSVDKQRKQAVHTWFFGVAAGFLTKHLKMICMRLVAEASASSWKNGCRVRRTSCLYRLDQSWVTALADYLLTK